MCMLSCFCCVQLFLIPWTIACQASRSMDSPDKNTGMGCHALLQGIFLIQGSNPCLLCLPALAGGFLTISAIWEDLMVYTYNSTFTSQT